MIDFSKYQRIKIPEGMVKTIKRKSDGLLLWKAGYVNQVPLSTNADGSIYNNGKGYKTGYRVRSGGAEQEKSNALCTGYIPVHGLSVVRVSGTWVDDLICAVNLSDASFTNLGQVVGNYDGYGIFDPGGEYAAYNSNTVVQKDGYWEWTVPPVTSAVAYIRVTAQLEYEAGFTVTVDEEIPTKI